MSGLDERSTVILQLHVAYRLMFHATAAAWLLQVQQHRRAVSLITRASTINVNDFKTGVTIEIDGAPFRVLGKQPTELSLVLLCQLCTDQEPEQQLLCDPCRDHRDRRPSLFDDAGCGYAELCRGYWDRFVCCCLLQSSCM